MDGLTGVGFEDGISLPGLTGELPCGLNVLLGFGFEDGFGVIEEPNGFLLGFGFEDGFGVIE